MTSLSIIQNITHAIIFILRFKGENYQQMEDFLLTDDLRTVQLQNFCDIFQRNNDQTFSRFKVQNYDFKKDDLVLKEIQNRHQNRRFIKQKYNCNCLICFGIEKNRVFREIHIPVSKATFLKVISLSPGEDTILSTKEVYYIIYNLFMILDNTNIIACTLLRQLIVDKELFDKLKILHQENVHSLMINYKGTLEAKSIELGNLEHILHSAFFNIHRIVMEEFVFVYKDKHNNVALTASKGDNKRKTHVVVDINLEDLLKPFCYLKIDSDFISQNWSLLQELLDKNSLFKSNMTLDIDFIKFRQLVVSQSQYIPEALTLSEIFENLLPGIFNYVGSFRLRLSEMTCSIDFRFLLDKSITLFFSEILFTSAVCLPQNMCDIVIHNSGVEGNLILPASTKSLYLIGVIMNKGAKLTLNDGCLMVEIKNTIGDIIIPASFGIDALSFYKQWKKCHILRNSTGATEELSIVEAELSQSWIINTGVKKIYFENVEAEEIFWVTINADCENMSFKNCTGLYNLSENTLLSSFGIMEFSVDNEFHFLNENGEYKLNIRNIDLNTITRLNGKIKTIVFENIYIQDDNVFSIHVDCKSISLKNCQGPFDFFFGTSVRRITQSHPTNYFSLQFNEHTGKYKMSLIEGNIDTSWMFSEKLEDLHLESIISENREHFEIKEGRDKIKLVNCNCLFTIPGILVNNHGHLKLNALRNELCLIKLSDNLFQLHMSDIFIYQTTHILLDIRFGKFERVLSNDNQKIKFEVRCEILFLINCDVLFDQPKTNIYERLILNKMFEISRILDIRTKELFMNNCRIIKDIQLSDTLYKLHFYDVEVLEKNTVTIPKHCINVTIRSCLGAFLIPGLNEHEDQATIFLRRLGNFYFFQYLGSDHYFLKIDNCKIERRICIRKDINHVILSNITFSSTRSSEKINESAVLITESVQSLKLKSSPSLYNATIHRKLTYLHLERMCFNHDVVIGGSVKRLILKNVTIERNSSVVFGEGISYLEIDNFNGVLNFNGFLNFQRLCFFGNERIIYERELQSGTVHLKVESLTFDSDYQFAEEVKTLHLTQVKIKSNSKISVNEACEKIVTDFEGEIYFIEVKNVKRAVFINRVPLFEINYWTFAASHNIKEIKTPSHLKSIRFEEIDLKSVTVTVNEGCKDISIIRCVGNFNLTKTPRLLKLTFHSKPFEMVILSYSSLRYVKELDLAFNFMLDFIEHLLCSCFNVEILTLQALTFNPNTSHWKRFSASDTEPFLSLFENFHLHKLERSLRENFPSEENMSGLWVMLNEKMNVLITPIFNTRSQFKLEVLKIVGFYFSDRNLDKLSNFSIMKKLSVDYNFVSTRLFERLPPNLETLEILSSDIFEPDNKNSMKNVRNAEAIKNIICPKVLIIEGSFFETTQNFSNLPINLHSLKISYHDLASVVYEPSIEKIRLRELYIFFKLTKSEECRFALSSIDKKICIQEMLRYLSDFIDFSRLDSLMVEDGDEKTKYDRFEIY